MKRRFLLSAVVVLLITSCASYYPQVVDIPLIKNKGDMRINAGYFVTPNFKGACDVGGHATYTAGVTDVLALQAYTSVDVMLRWHLQGALGLYKGFENNTVIEWYGGYGFGTGGYYNIQMDFYNLYFSQFNIGKTNVGKRNIDYGLGLKGGFVDNDYTEYNNYYINDVVQNNSWVIEPSLFFRFGGKKAKMNITINYMWADNIPDVYYFPLSIGMGVNFTVGKKKN